MKYKLVAFTVSLCLIFSLTGCRELVSTEYDEVEVVISDTHHKGAYTQIIMCGKTPVSIYHPAVYEIIVTYNDVEYTIDDEETYEKYKSKIGGTTWAVLEICTYDDGSVKYDITELY